MGQLQDVPVDGRPVLRQKSVHHLINVNLKQQPYVY